MHDLHVYMEEGKIQDPDEMLTATWRRHYSLQITEVIAFCFFNNGFEENIKGMLENIGSNIN